MSNTQFGQFVSILNPAAKPSRVNAFVEASRNQWPVPEPEWQGERQKHVSVPKRQSDESKLRDFLFCCRDGNLEEVRVYATRMPHLLAYTDRYGFSALHHTVMSENVELVSLVLKAYRHPRAFVRKSLMYSNLEALQSDGLLLQHGVFRSGPRLEESAVIVQDVPARSRANIEGICPDDMLEGIDATRIAKDKMNQDVLIRVPTAEEVVDACFGAGSISEQSFPITLKFCRPAHHSILANSDWTFLDRASSMSSSFRKIQKLIIRESNSFDPAPPRKARRQPPVIPSDSSSVTSSGVTSPSGVSSMGSPMSVASQRRATSGPLSPSMSGAPVKLPSLDRSISEPLFRR